ncbi:MAG: efflux RND transporter periplasmic adaptor subunit [Chitinophagaceae bacterium]|jgi:membrane fusion protein (multidrug efflux system)|nr:efflux RND transporter periplasmic adaptor subunit [Chitinophagaceae bacterium]
MYLKERLIVLLVPFTILAACKQKNETKAEVVPDVNVVAAGQRTVPVYTEYVGQTYGQSDVDIHARVDGWVLSMHFKEGDQVRKGQLLYVIDDLPIRERVDAARAKLAQAKTMMARAKSDLDRVEPLAKMNALSQRDLDAARAEYDATKSEVEQASAQLNTANIELGYTRITAPIQGIIGISNVLVGDYVNRGGIGKPLNTISTVGTVRVRFPISESEYLRFARRMRSDQDQVKTIQHIPVELILGDGTVFPETGKIDLANRQVDPATGSLIVQALFENKTGLLRPGQYVKVRFKTDEFKDAVLVPQQAVNQMQSIYQVFVLTDSLKLAPRVVQTGARTGSNWIITSGLKPGEKVAVVGNAAINPRNAIKPVNMNWNYDSTSYR